MKTVVAVDDSTDDTLLFQRACKKVAVSFELIVFNEAEQVIEHLDSCLGKPGQAPALLLLDLKIPRKSGFEILKWVREKPEFNDTKIVIFSSSQNDIDIKRCYASGSSWYFSKPVKYDHLIRFVASVNEYLQAQDETVLVRLPLYRPPIN